MAKQPIKINETPVTSDVAGALAAERFRVASILESEAGLKNPKMAIELALRSTMETDSAIALLASAPAQNPFLEAMAKFGQVNISAAVNAPPEGSKEARLAEIKQSVQAFNAERGWKKD